MKVVAATPAAAFPLIDPNSPSGSIRLSRRRESGLGGRRRERGHSEHHIVEAGRLAGVPCRV